MLRDIVEFVLVGLRDWALYMGGAFVLLWFIFRRRIEHRKIQLKQRANSKQWVHEVKWTLAAQLGFVAGLLIFGDGTSPGLFVQLDTNRPTTLVATSLAFVLIDDAWFYWTHRFLHANQRLYRSVHKIHHRSIDTGPLTSLSFHPIESFIINIPLAILPLFIGVGPSFFFWSIYISTLNNIAGHNGFEWAPKWWNKIPLLRGKAPSLHHNLHHEKSRGNYGLYFTYWDRWMGTQFADYDERAAALRDRITKRSSSSSTTSSTTKDPQPVA